VPKALLEKKAQLALVENKVQQVTRGHRVQLVQLVKLEYQEAQAQLVHKAYRVQLVLKVLQDLKVQQGPLVILDQQDHLEKEA
jgi:hypothetical protein